MESKDGREIDMAKHVILKDKEEASTGFGGMAAVVEGVCNGIKWCIVQCTSGLRWLEDALRGLRARASPVQPWASTGRHCLMRYSLVVACVSWVPRVAGPRMLSLCCFAFTYQAPSLRPPSQSERSGVLLESVLHLTSAARPEHSACTSGLTD
jgi:hypothetical protein